MGPALGGGRWAARWRGSPGFVSGAFGQRMMRGPAGRVGREPPRPPSPRFEVCSTPCFSLGTPECPGQEGGGEGGLRARRAARLKSFL